MNPQTYFNRSLNIQSSSNKTGNSYPLLTQIMIGAVIPVGDFDAVLEQLRIEAVDSFLSVPKQGCEFWGRAFQYGYWISELEAMRNIDRRVQQILDFSQNLGNPPTLPKFGLELMNEEGEIRNA